jgi:hypothetical protein
MRQAPQGLRGPNVVDFLRSRGVESLDGIVVSNPDADHVGGFVDVFDAFEARSVYVSAESPAAQAVLPRSVGHRSIRAGAGVANASISGYRGGAQIILGVGDRPRRTARRDPTAAGHGAQTTGRRPSTFRETYPRGTPRAESPHGRRRNRRRSPAVGEDSRHTQGSERDPGRTARTDSRRPRAVARGTGVRGSRRGLALRFRDALQRPADRTSGIGNS